MNRPAGDPFEEILAYVGFGPETSRALRRLEPKLPRVLDALVADFYEEVLRHEEARRVIVDEAQLARLKLSLAAWARALVAGPHDRSWLEQSLRIGRRHVEVGLAQRFMPLAMNRLRRFLTRLALEELAGRPDELVETVQAVDAVIDLELTIMLESYQEMQRGRVRQAERLGTLGQLAASVSHELKNPLAVINTSLLILSRELARQDGARDPELVQSHLDRIGRSSRLASRLSSQLLDYARAKQPRLRQVALSQVVQDALELAEPVAGVAIDWRCDPADAFGLVDASDLTQVLSNVVRNAGQALRESGKGGRITVRARRDDVGLVFVVSDDGPGIPPAVLPRIFEPLFTTRTNGTGLGLAICRDLVAAHGGTISVASTPGNGATFTILIPQEKPE